MTKVGLLAIVIYGIDILLLIKRLRVEYLDITWPRYAENDGALCTIVNIELCSILLKTIQPRLWVLHRTIKKRSDRAPG